MSYPLQQTVSAEVFKVGSAYHTRRRDGTAFSHATVPTTVIQNAIDNLTAGSVLSPIYEIENVSAGAKVIELFEADWRSL